jgi:ATP-dependent DNA helicase PIF1
VEKFNTIALRANLQDAAAVPVGLFVKTRGDVQNVAAWINEQKFRRFHSVALGARVMLTSNVNVEKGLTNGAIGVVRALRYDTHPDTGEQYLRTIRVEFTAHAGQSVSINVTRSVVQETYRDGVSFQKSTFPLQLAYAFTGHKAQGSTMRGTTIINMRDCFTLGLAYVMLSRVGDRRQLRIIGGLTPEQCLPMPLIATPPSPT